ncbi:hypothetical protein OAG71_00575 [bacterium]|nr:hypothetical protein [bacterium]
MNDATSGYSTISSAWFSLVYGEGNIRERLANALSRAVSITGEDLTKPQQQHFQKLGGNRFCNMSETQMLEFVESLKQDKMHELADTIAQLYFVTINTNQD